MRFILFAVQYTDKYTQVYILICMIDYKLRLVSYLLQIRKKTSHKSINLTLYYSV